jgi:hypothetical protein
MMGISFILCFLCAFWPDLVFQYKEKEYEGIIIVSLHSTPLLSSSPYLPGTPVETAAVKISINSVLFSV